MMSNKRLYTLDPKAFENEVIDQAKLVKNSIDIDFLSHLILFPEDFIFDSYYAIDLKKLKSNEHLKGT